MLLFLILFSLALIPSLSAMDLPVLNRKGPYEVLALNTEVDGDTLFRLVALNEYGQVCYIAIYSSKDGVKMRRYDPRYIHGMNIRLYNTHKIMNFEFTKNTAGCSLTIEGSDGKIKSLMEVPRGLLAPVEAKGNSYFFFMDCESARALPIKEADFKQWIVKEQVAKMIEDGLFVKNVKKRERQQSDE